MVQDIIDQKAVVLTGLARGGTNITWNILQSHPNIVSPIFETNQIIGGRSYYAPFKQLLCKGKGIALVRNHIKSRFRRYKIKNLNSADNQYKYDGLRYTREEIERATLCIKGVCSHRNWDIHFTDLFYATFPDVYFISLIRNGFAICESWKRRGVGARKSGILYAKFCEKMLKDAERLPRYKIIRFEDVLASPFGMANELFTFVEEEYRNLPKLRIKVKKVIDETQNHTHRYGSLNRKYWFTPENIHEIIRGDVNDVQQKSLTEGDKKAFENEAREALAYFNYL